MRPFVWQSFLPLGSVCRNFGQKITQGIVHAYTAENDSQITDIKIAVKPQRHTGQKKTGQLITSISVEPVPSNQCDGQKDENENIRIE